MKLNLSKTHALMLVLTLLFATIATFAGAQTTNQIVYDNQLENGWQNWSWASTNTANTSPVHSGGNSIAVTPGSWQAAYFVAPEFDCSPYASISFWINGGQSGGQVLQVNATTLGLYNSENAGATYNIPALAANTWQQITIPLATLGVANDENFNGFWIQDRSGYGDATFYVDDICLIASTTPPTPISIDVNPTANLWAISPMIYGTAWTDPVTMADLNAPLNRMGGDGMSCYNWQQNAEGKGFDYYYESIGDANPTPGFRADNFIAQNDSVGVKTMMTIPMLGWMANLGPNRSILYSFSQQKYGAQTSSDPYLPDSGNGILASTGQDVVGNNPNDAMVPSSVSTQTAWINHLVSTWGPASSGGLSYYIMDNEPSLWFAVHRDVHPIGPTEGEIANDMIAYGTAVKTADPSAQVVGPEEWGWTGYFDSGYDQQYGGSHGWSYFPDKVANGNLNYIPYLLTRMQAQQAATGTRLLDVCSVHFYPQNNENTGYVDLTEKLLRNRSTRQLWDTNYISESWISTSVQLIPRLRAWVSQYYPGTKIAITEYNWGAEQDMNGATTQADIYGIFGAYRLDMATRWTTPPTNSPTYLAMKMYRNYDGNDSTFGDTSCTAKTTNLDNLSSYGAIRSSDGALTVMVINKRSSGYLPINMDITHFNQSGTAHVWQLNSSGVIAQLPDIKFNANVKTNLPGPSVTLFVIPSTLNPTAH